MLTPEQYHVTREKGTERPFTGKYWQTKTSGTYRCVACGQELFDSEQKFDSATGWPSFWRPIAEGRVNPEADPSLGMVRTEVLCSRCDAHLGHVFDDGPGSFGSALLPQFGRPGPRRTRRLAVERTSSKIGVNLCPACGLTAAVVVAAAQCDQPSERFHHHWDESDQPSGGDGQRCRVEYWEYN